MLKKYIGNKQFYKAALAIALPIMLQNGITNFVSMLDNIMIGRVGQTQMTGVAVANQLMFVFNLAIFGALSGAGIFGAQFHGKGDVEGVRNSFRFKLMIGAFLVAVGTIVLAVWGKDLIGLYLRGDGTVEDAEATLKYGLEYLTIMVMTFLPFALCQSYASTLRETGESVLPMTAGIVAVFVNLAFNWVLIYGNLGAPALGVRGAAIATAISRLVELSIVVISTHVRRAKFEFARGLYKKIFIPASLFGSIALRGLPLLLNETLWSAGMATLAQCYSVRSLDVMSAVNITNTLFNVFNVGIFALSTTVGIIVGHALGAGDVEKAKDTARKMIALVFVIAIGVGVVYAACSTFFPDIYNATDSAKSTASSFIIVGAIFMPMSSLCHACYYTLRAGGKTFVTFLFDSVFVWLLAVPTAYVLAHFTALPIVGVYAAVVGLDTIKAIIGTILVKKGVWIHNIVNKE